MFRLANAKNLPNVDNHVENVVNLVENFHERAVFLRFRQQNPSRPSAANGRPMLPFWPIKLAFELNLQDFSWQANQAGLGQVGWASTVVHPYVLFCLMIRSAVWSHPLDFDAESSFQLEEISALFPEK